MALVKQVEVVVKLTPAGVANGLNFLGPDGRNYTLYYRVNETGPWLPIQLVENFPS